MVYDNLPIFRSCMNLVVYIETTVRTFEKYHKYTIGADLRTRSQSLLFLIQRANMAQDKSDLLLQLRDECEAVKMTILIAKELKAFRSFKQFEHCVKLGVDVCKQAQAWLGAATKPAGVLHARM